MVASSARDARTGARWTRVQRAKNDAIYWGIRAALWVADRVPSGLLVELGRAVGWASYLLLRGPRRVALANLRVALPDHDAQAVCRRCFRNAGENLALTLLLRRPALRALDLVQVPSDARTLLRTTLSEGRGAVFVSAHLGPFELVAAAVAELGLEPAVVVRESYDLRLDPIVDRHRAERGVQVIHRGRRGAASSILGALRAGKPVGLLPDLGGRVESQRGLLLGQVVDLPVGPQRIAVRAGCPVLVGTLAPLRAEQFRPGRWPASPLPRYTMKLRRLHELDEVTLGSRIAETLASHICEAPDQWLWMAPRFRSLQHNRA